LQVVYYGRHVVHLSTSSMCFWFLTMKMRVNQVQRYDQQQIDAGD